MEFKRSTQTAIIQGDTWKRIYTWTDANGRPVDVSGNTVWFTIKRTTEDLDAAAVLQKSFLLPSDADSAAGIFRFTLSSAETDIPPGIYVYDIRVVEPDPPGDLIITSIETGRLQVFKPVTSGI